MSTATQHRGTILAERLGIKIIGTEGHDLKAACVVCNSSDGMRVDQATGKAWCFVCESKWSPYDLALAILDKPQAINLMVEIGEFEPRDGNGNGRPREDIVATVARLKRIPIESLKAYGARADVRGKAPVCRVPAYNAQGEQHSHFDLPRDGGKGWFRQGAGSSGIFFPGHLPQPSEKWHVVEGVKDAAALHGLGFLAVGLNTSRMASKYARLFRDVDVVIIGDRDRAGESGAEDTASHLHGVARYVQVVTLPAEFKAKDGPDVRDVLAMKNGEDMLRQALEDAREWEPKQDQTCASSGGDVRDGLPSIVVAQGRTDLVNANRLLALHHETVLHMGAWKRWLTWDGRRWCVDEVGKIEQRAKDVPQILWTRFVDEYAK